MGTANPSYKPSEGKREEFRKYLEKNGVMDALTKVLVNLYEEEKKPEDALEYIRDKLAVIAGIETYKQLQQKIAETEERVKDLEKQVQSVGETDIAVTDDSPTEQPTEEPQVMDSNDKVPAEKEPGEDINPEPEQ
ncbi:c-Myc-binding protein homolog [Rhynchophorus ferrugineus]|uniref:c-Myc-binding protein n=1 Tax=Rhynchophorus ferrugineus TaxID=354439 RepID=A0A834IRS8_RHYFE|nr:hypothetical protein GWI33_022832 [Rhynchophorus ferrugineus]